MVLWTKKTKKQWTLCLASCVIRGSLGPVLKQEKKQEREFFFFLPLEKYFWWPHETNLPGLPQYY